MERRMVYESSGFQITNACEHQNEIKSKRKYLKTGELDKDYSSTL